MSDYSEGHAQVAGVRLHYVEAGPVDGPAVLLLHGFPSCWLSFAPQLEALSDRYRVVAVDALGANGSERPDDLDAYRLENLAAQIDALARDRFGERRFTFVGHDWGAGLAWAYAQGYGERLHGVIAISAPPPNQILHLLETNEEQRHRSRYMFAMRGGSTHRRMTENGSHAVWKEGYEVLRGLPQFTAEIDEGLREALAVPGAVDAGINWYRANVPEPDAMTDADYWPSRHARVQVPALLIWGNDDQTFVPQFIDELGDYVDDPEILRLDDTRHWVTLQRPDETNEAIADFVDRHAGR